jgi:hypothetical protein
VGDTIHANPRILGVHFLHNLVPLGLLVTNNEQVGHLIRLASHCNCSAFLCLEDALELFQGSEAKLLGFFGLVGRLLENRRHFLPDGRERQRGRLDFAAVPFFTIMRRTVMMWTR